MLMETCILVCTNINIYFTENCYIEIYPVHIHRTIYSIGIRFSLSSKRSRSESITHLKSEVLMALLEKEVNLRGGWSKCD